MTDNEIIKALDKCASIGESCEDCPFYDYTDCDKRLKEHFHDLINRQKAEIESLRYANKTVLKSEKQKRIELYDKAKSEAIKEFAERLKNCFCVSKEYLDIMNIIDNLVKEYERNNYNV